MMCSLLDFQDIKRTFPIILFTLFNHRSPIKYPFTLQECDLFISAGKETSSGKQWALCCESIRL